MILAGCLAACSNGSVPNSGATEEAQGSNGSPGNSTESNLDAVAGTVLIQERHGKRVFDAFFTHVTQQETESAMVWSADGQVCRASTLAIGDSSVALKPVNNMPTFLAVSSVNLHDRGGQFLSLTPQILGTTVVYSSDIRWMDSELPVGTYLSVRDSRWFPESATIELLPLQQIDRLEPETGLLSRSQSRLRWVSSGTEVDRIQLVFTPQYESVETMNAVTSDYQRVYCIVTDTGTFDLPDNVRDALGNPDNVHVLMSRRRTSSVEHDGSELTVHQISSE